MNQDKAREFFSAFYEGTLEAGLRQQLEARFRADAHLKADYAAFVETIESLDNLRFEEIEVPLFLNDRIATRLEQDEAKRKTPLLAWTNWFRGLGYSGLAAAALIAAFVAIRTEGGSTATASLIPGASAVSTSPANRLSFAAEGSKVVVSYRAEGTRSVVVSAANGRRLQVFPLSTGGQLRTPLSNDHSAPALLRVNAAGDPAGSALVALPGSEKQAAAAGTGSLQDLAAALAGRYGVPVVVRGDVEQKVTWTLDVASPLRAAEAAVTGTHASVDQRDGGLITILAN